MSDDLASSSMLSNAEIVTPTEWLECITCGARYELSPMLYGCSGCASRGAPSAVEMRYAKRGFTIPIGCSGEGVWAWRSHLPGIAEQARTTLGEGSTNLLPLHDKTPGPRIFLKNETSNPTWSWKDRPNAVSVSVAKHFGYSDVTAISTGNHGNALAALAAVAGLQATVFCRDNTPLLQIAMMEAYGARVIRGGDSEAMLRELLRQGNYFPCTVLSLHAGFSNPFGAEGFKTIAFEIWKQLGRVPHRVFVGVGSGDGIYGIWKGFRELLAAGAADTLPRMVACQTEGANSLVRAFRNREQVVTPLEVFATVASSLAEPAASQQALRAVYDSAGLALQVSDEQALATMRWMSRRGISLEPSSAVPLACLQKLREQEGETAAEEIWVSIGSGAGPKWPEDLIRGFQLPPSMST